MRKKGRELVKKKKDRDTCSSSNFLRSDANKTCDMKMHNQRTTKGHTMVYQDLGRYSTCSSTIEGIDFRQSWRAEAVVASPKPWHSSRFSNMVWPASATGTHISMEGIGFSEMAIRTVLNKDMNLEMLKCWANY